MIGRSLSSRSRWWRSAIAGVFAFCGGGAVHAQSWTEDSNFAPLLEAPGNAPAASIHALPGGKALVDSFYTINGTRCAGLARLNADGSLDSAFTSPTGGAYSVLAVYDDGRLLAQRSVSPKTGEVRSIVRLLANGAVDPTFAEAVLSYSARPQVVLLADGRILLSGSFSSVAGAARQNLALLETDGRLASGFTSPFPADVGELIAVPAANGGFYVSGGFFNLGADKRSHFVRLTAAGAIDPGFNPASSPVGRVYGQADGKVIVLVATDLVRLNVDGTIDPTFGRIAAGDFAVRPSDGAIFYSRSRDFNHTEVRRINSAGQADTLVATVSGSTWLRPEFTLNDAVFFASPLTDERRTKRYSVTRVQASGAIDPAFSPQFSLRAVPAAFAAFPDGRVLLAGMFDRVNGEDVPDGFGVFRFNANGTMDTSFVRPALALESVVSAMYQQPDGKVVLSGTFPDGSSTRFVVRLRADGSLDPAFSQPERLQTILAFDPTGRFYGTPGDGTLLRYLPDGAIDPAFTAAVSVGLGRAVAPFADGTCCVSIPVSPGSSSYMLAGLRADGSRDTTFAVASRSAFPSLLTGLVSLPDGQVLLYGASSAAFGVGLRFLRIARDGVINYTYFGPDLHASQIGANDGLILAGVLHDLLADAASGAARLQTGYVTPSFRSSAFIDVGRDNTLYARINNEGTVSFARYARASSSALTIDAQPTILFQSSTGPTVLPMGGSVTLSNSFGGLFPLTYQWFKDGSLLPNSNGSSWAIMAARPEDAGSYFVTASNSYGSVSTQPVTVEVDTVPQALTASQQMFAASQGRFSLQMSATGNPVASFAWNFNGGEVPAGSDIAYSSGFSGRTTSSTLTFSSVSPAPARAGLYTVTASNSREQVASQPFILGVASEAKVTGAGTEAGADIRHPNGNVFDQVLLTGAAAAVTADPGQITRVSFVDLNRDIVQVEFSGAGTLSVVLDGASSPTPPLSYDQPSVSYITGHAGLVVRGADGTTHLSVFSVGHLTAVNQALFRDDVTYDGVADLAFIAIQSTAGEFGSLRAGNANFFATRGTTGLYAPGVRFTGPVILGDIDAHDAATPSLVLASTNEPVRIAGGNLAQANGRRVVIEGAPRLAFADGANSHGVRQPVQANQARFERNGVDVTNEVTISGSP